METLDLALLAHVKYIINIYSKLFQYDMLLHSLESDQKPGTSFERSLVHEIKKHYKEIGIHKQIMEHVNEDSTTFYNKLATRDAIFQIYSNMTTLNKILCSCMFSIPNEVIYFRVSKSFFKKK